MKIAVLGLGNMGLALSERLLQGGHHLTVWNRSKGRADPLLEIGATEADTPAAAVTSAEVVITSLANDDAVRGGRTGGGRDPLGHRRSDLRRLLDHLARAERRTRVKPSPASSLSRSSVPRRPSAPVTPCTWRVVPLRPSTAYGRFSRRCPSGSKYYPRQEMASAAKLAANLLLLSGIATLAEAFTVARAGGLGDEELTDLFAESALVAPGVKNRFRAILEGPAQPGGRPSSGRRTPAWPPSRSLLRTQPDSGSVPPSETCIKPPPMPASATTTSPSSPASTAEVSRGARAPSPPGPCSPCAADNVHYVKFNRIRRDAPNRTAEVVPLSRALPWPEPGRRCRRPTRTSRR